MLVRNIAKETDFKSYNINLSINIHNNIIEFNKKLNNVNGWFSASDQYLFDFLLIMQNQLNITGNLLEIGLWEGKSLFKILNYCRHNEILFGLDSNVKYDKLQSNYENFNNISSLRLIQDFSHNIKKYKDINNIRFCHIDGDHTGAIAYNDIIGTSNYVNDDAILVLDDFHVYYIGVMQAYYKAYFTNKTKFVPFVMSNQKLYLCTRKNYYTYYNYVKSNIVPFLKNFDSAETTIKFVFDTDNTNITNIIMASQKSKNSIDFSNGFGRNLIYSFSN